MKARLTGASRKIVWRRRSASEARAGRAATPATAAGRRARACAHAPAHVPAPRPPPPREKTVEVAIPSSAAGVIIGKGGATIDALQKGRRAYPAAARAGGGGGVGLGDGSVGAHGASY